MAIKETKEITRKQVFAGVRTVKAQRTQTALITATKANKDFNTMKNNSKRSIH